MEEFITEYIDINANYYFFYFVRNKSLSNQPHTFLFH